MGTSSLTGRSLSRGFALATLGLIAALVGCSGTPQLGDSESLGAADALWTAITAKDPDLLEASASEIKQLHADAKMPDDAFQCLTDVIATARSGKWAEARAALKAFVRGQRPVARCP